MRNNREEKGNNTKRERKKRKKKRKKKNNKKKKQHLDVNQHLHLHLIFVWLCLHSTKLSLISWTLSFSEQYRNVIHTKRIKCLFIIRMYLIVLPKIYVINQLSTWIKVEVRFSGLNLNLGRNAFGTLQLPILKEREKQELGNEKNYKYETICAKNVKTRR